MHLQVLPELQNEFKANLSDLVRPCLEMENYRNGGRGAGEDGLVLVEDPSSVPNSHVKGLNHL